MGRKVFSGTGFILLLVLSMTVTFEAKSQTTMPEVLSKGTFKEQMDYINEKTRIYEDYRAIREDMFQRIRGNSLDSLRAAKSVITGLQKNVKDLNLTIDTLKASLETVKTNLDQMAKTKNSISLMGMQINKVAYNAVMWIIIAGLAGILAVGFLVFKRNHAVTAHTKKEFEDLKREFEAYRKASREAREKMSMAHFNELKKLRGA
jgi:chaperonin cofactor prefoldin